MPNKTNLSFLAAIFITANLALPVAAQNTTVASIDKTSNAPAASTAPGIDTDRTRDGLTGTVRRVRTEITKLSNKGGKASEGPRALMEESAYDLKGAKTETAYYPVAGATLTGKETYKYDDKGNISEMTLMNADGSLLSKETYAYEFDFAGNWSKMTTSVAVIEGGKLSFEPTEVTYRTISYYLDQNMLKITQPAATTTAGTIAAPAKVSQPATVQATNVAAHNGIVNAKTPALPQSNTSSLNKSAAPLSIAAAAPLGSTINAPVAKTVVEEPPPAAAANVAAKPVPKPLMRPVSGGVLNGSALSLPAPSYPDMAKRTHTTGTINIEVVIDEQGKVISARSTGGNPLLARAAEFAARQARFAPTKLSGQPVKVAGMITYNFKLLE